VKLPQAILTEPGVGAPAAGKFSVLLGGLPRSGPPTKTFEALIRQLGFGLFPWSAVVIFALARPLTRLDGEGNRTNPRLAFVQLYLLLFAGLGFAVSGYLNIVIGDVRYIALPAMALSLGAFLDEALEGNGAEPVAGLLMGIGTLIIARDFLLTPEELASVHVIDKVRWPSTIQIGSLSRTIRRSRQAVSTAYRSTPSERRRIWSSWWAVAPVTGRTWATQTRCSESRSGTHKSRSANDRSESNCQSPISV